MFADDVRHLVCGQENVIDCTQRGVTEMKIWCKRNKVISIKGTLLLYTFTIEKSQTSHLDSLWGGSTILTSTLVKYLGCWAL